MFCTRARSCARADDAKIVRSRNAQCKTRESPKGRSRPLLLRISSAHAIHWSRACHVIFERAHRVEISTKYRADDLCVNLVCEYFCWTLGDPHFFFGRSLPFLTLSIILKNKKNLCVGSFNHFSYSF